MRFRLTSDSFNPMLVRDLRQGLRSKHFSGLFLLLHGTMAFCVILVLITSDKSSLVNLLNAVLCTGLFVYFYLGLPLMATGAFTAEYRENRIDLLKLTQMRSRGLVWGKWWSYFVQGAMVAISLLPYLILTYFIGGIELASELTLIGMLLGFSALLVGFCVTISCVNLQAFRVLLVLFLVIFGFITAVNILGGIAFRGGGVFMLADTAGMFALLMLLAGLPMLFLVLEFGASRLAPFSENHDTPQRFVALLVLVVTLAGIGLNYYSTSRFWDEFIEAYAPFSGLALFWVMIFAAASEPLPYPSAYRPFVRRGALGKWLGRLLLYPGWPSAVFFILFFAMMELGIFFVMGQVIPTATPEWDRVVAICALMPAALLFPQLVSHWLRRTRLSPGLRYFVGALGPVILLLVGTAFSSVTGNSIFAVVTCVFPPNAWIFLSSGQLQEINEPLIPVAVVFAAGGGVLVTITMIIRAVRYWAKFAELERRAQESLATPEPAELSAPSAPVPPAKSPSVPPSAG